MHGHALTLPQAVELIDATQASICEHQGARFQHPLATLAWPAHFQSATLTGTHTLSGTASLAAHLFHSGNSQPGPAAAPARRDHCAGAQARRVLHELRLACRPPHAPAQFLSLLSNATHSFILDTHAPSQVGKQSVSRDSRACARVSNKQHMNLAADVHAALVFAFQAADQH